jgi:hypothetical protein
MECNVDEILLLYIHLDGNIFDVLLELIGKLADWRIGWQVLG